MSRKKKMINDATMYLSASLFTLLITLVSSLLTRLYLGPVQQGIWSLIQVVLIYLAWTTFGVTEVISCHIPFYSSRGENDMAEMTKNSVFSFVMCSSLIVSVAIFIYALLNRNNIQKELFYGLLFIPVILMLQRYTTLCICFLRSLKLFSLASRQTVVSSIVNAVLVITLSYRYQIYGFLCAMCISYTFDLIFVSFQYNFKFKFYLNLRIIWKSIKFGFPLVMAGVATGICVNADRVMIAKFMSLKALGVYSIAVMTFTYLRNFANPVCVVLLPNLHERFGETGDPKQLSGYMTKASAFFCNIMPIMIGGYAANK